MTADRKRVRPAHSFASLASFVLPVKKRSVEASHEPIPKSKGSGKSARLSLYASNFSSRLDSLKWPWHPSLSIFSTAEVLSEESSVGSSSSSRTAGVESTDNNEDSTLPVDLGDLSLQHIRSSIEGLSDEEKCHFLNPFNYLHHVSPETVKALRLENGKSWYDGNPWPFRQSRGRVARK